MRAAPEGPGWWQASDGQWYPPELHPAVLAGDRSVEDLRAAPITGRADRTTIRWVAETTTEPEPAPEPEPEPAQAWGPEPEPVQAWEPEPAQAWGPEPEPVQAWEPEPEPVQAWEPEPEPAQAWEPEPEPTWEPEWEPEPEPAPVRAVAAVGPAPSPSPTAPPPIPGAEDFGPERPSRFLLLGVAAAALALIAISAFTFLTNRDEASEPAAEGAGSVDTTASSSPPPDTDTAPTDTDTPGTETTAPAVTVAPVLAQVADLEEGDCLANPDLGLGDPTAMALADCDGPHTHEVFLTADFQPIDDAFDLAALQVFAAETCEAGFEAFVGEPYVSSRYLYVALGPTRDSWAAGERGIACLIYDPRGEVSGTLRGVGS